MGAIFYYVSSHGYGHATRSAEIIAHINRIRPEIRVHVRSAAPEKIFRAAGCRILHTDCRCDIGVIQPDGLTMKIPETATALLHLMKNEPELLAREIAAAQADRVGLVVSDVPSFAFRVAKKLGVPGIAITNFSWDWIYDYWVPDYPVFQPIIEKIRSEYALCDLLLKLPFSEFLPAFKTVRDIPLVARKAKHTRPAVLQGLNLPDNKPLVLLSFGGMGLRSLDPDKLFGMKTIRFISVGTGNPAVRNISEQDLQTNGFRYPDLVAAADAVVTKPGYGIVSECIANRTPILFTDRGPFREYPVLVQQMKNMLPTRFVPQEKFIQGNWESELTELLSASEQCKLISCNGAETAARACMEMLQ